MKTTEEILNPKTGKEGGKCNHIDCYSKSNKYCGVKFGKEYVFFCEEHYDSALTTASK